MKRNFYKLMNNASYGNTFENVAKLSDIRLVTEEDKACQLAEKPHCLDFRIFDKNLIGVEMRKLRHVINKPFQHGFCVLEWSKLKMYNLLRAHQRRIQRQSPHTLHRHGLFLPTVLRR